MMRIENHGVTPNVPGWWSEFLQPAQRLGQRAAEFLSPSAEAAVAEDHYEISVELPGVDRDHIDLDLHDGRLTVTGEKHDSREEKTKSYYFSERSYGRFKRVFQLPPDVDQDKIAASYKDGVLTIMIAKQMPKVPNPKKIPVNQG